jgi:hypothetical protein
MSRWLAALLAAVLVGACTSPPPPTATPPADAAALTVTGSGEFCGPWWYGCGAYLAIEDPSWSLPDDWAPGADDTQFDVDPQVSKDGPAKITGIVHLGQARIEPGRHQFVVITTETPDSPATPPMSASFGCSVVVDIPTGTRAVGVDVRFGFAGCTIGISKDVATHAPSS